MVRFSGSGAAVDRTRVVRAKAGASGGLIGSRGWGESNRLSLADAHTRVVTQGLTPYCDQIVTVFDGSGFLLRSLFLLLVLLLFCLLILFAFLLFLTLILVLFTTFVTHGVTPFRLTFFDLPTLRHNNSEVGGIEQAQPG